MNGRFAAAVIAFAAAASVATHAVILPEFLVQLGTQNLPAVRSTRTFCTLSATRSYSRSARL